MNRTLVIPALAAALFAGSATLPAHTARAAAPIIPSITVLGGNVKASDNAAYPGTYLSVTGAGFTPGGRVSVRVVDAGGTTLFDSAALPVQPQASTAANDRAWHPTAAKTAILPGGDLGLQVRIAPTSARAASVIVEDMASQQQVVAVTSVGF